MQSPQVKPSDAEDEEGIQRGILGRKGETGEADYQGGEKIEKVSSDQELCMTQERQTVGDESKPEVEVQHSLDRSESSMDKLYEDSSDVWASELRDESPVKKVQAGARVKNEFQQWIKMLRRPGTCRHMCHQDEGSIANAVLWQLLFLLAAALSGITALTLSQNDASKDWKTDGVRIHNIFAYSACICATYVVTKWMDSLSFWILRRLCRPCGKFSKTFTFYITSIEGAFARALWVIVNWALYRPIFEIRLSDRTWLDRLWGTLFALALIDGVRVFIQRWILSTVLRSTYEAKVNDVSITGLLLLLLLYKIISSKDDLMQFLTRMHVVKVMCRPFKMEDIRHRAITEDWANHPNANVETEERLLIDSEATLAEKLNFIHEYGFSLDDSTGGKRQIKREQELKPYVEKVFTRLVGIPPSLVNEAAKTAKKAADHMAEGSARVVTYVSPSDAVYNENITSVPKMFPSFQSAPSSEFVIDVDTKSPKAHEQESSTVDDLSSGKDVREQKPVTRLRKKIVSGIFSSFGRKKNSEKSTPVIKKFVSGELVRAHFFLVLGKEYASDAVSKFDRNGDGRISFDELSTQFFDVLQSHNSLSESERSHQSVSKAVYYVGTGAALMFSLIVVLPIWQVPLTEIFVPIGTLVIALSFAIGGTLQNLLSALIFLTVVQPYNVGERVTSPSLLDGETLIVNKVDVLTTTFQRLSGKKFIVPNSTMAGLVVENLKRSTPAIFFPKFHLSYETTAEQLHLLKEKVLEYLNNHPRQWRPEVLLLTMDATPGPNNMLTIMFEVAHTMGWQNGIDIWSSYSNFVMHVSKCLKELKIQYELPVQPVKHLTEADYQTTPRDSPS